VEGSLDWGTIAVYTCQNNCDPDDQGGFEFVWKQDFKPDDDETKK
jgi:pre-rRNA-processing protein TSR4